MPSSTVEDYLKCILLEQERLGEDLVPTGQVATALNVRPATATAMMKALADAGLVHYEPYAGVRLTGAGQRLAKRVLRRHRLLELFLVRVMGMSWSEVHREAEVLEHAVSETLIERMDAMLGHPSADPHGDPIPTAGGEVPGEAALPSLRDCPLQARARVVRVKDQRSEFLQLLETHGVMPGRIVRVRRRDEVAETMELETEGGPSLKLGLHAAARIQVEPLDPG